MCMYIYIYIYILLKMCLSASYMWAESVAPHVKAWSKGPMHAHKNALISHKNTIKDVTVAVPRLLLAKSEFIPVP